MSETTGIHYFQAATNSYGLVHAYYLLDGVAQTPVPLSQLLNEMNARLCALENENAELKADIEREREYQNRRAAGDGDW